MLESNIGKQEEGGGGPALRVGEEVEEGRRHDRGLQKPLVPGVI